MYRGQCLLKLLEQNSRPEDEDVKLYIDELLENLPKILGDFISSFERSPQNAYSLYLAILEAVRTGKYFHQ